MTIWIEHAELPTVNWYKRKVFVIVTTISSRDCNAMKNVECTDIDVY